MAVKGRWDIDFVENPQYQYDGYFSSLSKSYLMAVHNQHPDAWESLKAMIKEVENETRSPREVMLVKVEEMKKARLSKEEVA